MLWGIAMDDDVIRTGVYHRNGGRRLYWDDPKDRQRYARYLKPKQREKFAMDYTRQVLEAREKARWYRKALKK
jgi:hypothetical protein